MLEGLLKFAIWTRSTVLTRFLLKYTRPNKKLLTQAIKTGKNGIINLVLGKCTNQLVINQFTQALNSQDGNTVNILLNFSQNKSSLRLLSKTKLNSYIEQAIKDQNTKELDFLLDYSDDKFQYWNTTIDKNQEEILTVIEKKLDQKELIWVCTILTMGLKNSITAEKYNQIPMKKQLVFKDDKQENKEQYLEELKQLKVKILDRMNKLIENKTTVLTVLDYVVLAASLTEEPDVLETILQNEQIKREIPSNIATIFNRITQDFSEQNFKVRMSIEKDEEVPDRQSKILFNTLSTLQKHAPVETKNYIRENMPQKWKTQLTEFLSKTDNAKQNWSEINKLFPYGQSDNITTGTQVIQPGNLQQITM
ncbi:MAG: hypothetical protein HRK26_01750 [Rickettsiaceae bacterium H1]|nr:hypothetical protein [Rickettsiaceae bacterium H1]